MKTLTLTFALLLALTGCMSAEFSDMAGQAQCELQNIAVDPDDDSFTRVNQDAVGAHSDTLSWSFNGDTPFSMTVRLNEDTTTYVDSVPLEGTDVPVTGGGAAFDPEGIESDGQRCADYVEAEVQVVFRTEDGRLDTVFPGTIMTDSAGNPRVVAAGKLSDLHPGSELNLDGREGDLVLSAWFVDGVLVGTIDATEYTFSSDGMTPESADVWTVASFPAP